MKKLLFLIPTEGKSQDQLVDEVWNILKSKGLVQEEEQDNAEDGRREDTLPRAFKEKDCI